MVNALKNNILFLSTVVKNCRPLGMESYYIFDWQITASSEWRSNRDHGPRNGRLNFQVGNGRIGGWSAHRSDVNQWLQVHFTKTTIVAKVATQGRMDMNQWVTSFSLSHSMDGNNYIEYQESGAVKVSFKEWSPR